MGNGIIGVINYTYKSYVNDSNPILDAEYETRRSVEKEVKRVSKLSPSEMGSELLDVAMDLRSYESFAEFLLLRKLAPNKTLPANRNLSTKPGGITLKDFDLQVGPSFESFSTVIKDGRINISNRAVTSGKFDFVITADGELKVGFGHSYLSGGAGTVKAAGQLEIFKGKIKSITNNSGHYKPNIIESENFGNLLREQGLDLNGAKLKQYDASGKIEKTTTLQ